MKTTWLRVVAPLALVMGLTACPPPACDPEIDFCEPDGGSMLLEDFCDTPEEAVSDSRCQLTLCGGLDGGKLEYINPPGDGGADQDWYSVQLGTLTPRTLLHVTAGYSAPATPVSLAVTVLRETGTNALARKVDDHGQAAPKPVDIILPFSESNAKLLLLLTDKGGRSPPVFDGRNPYAVTVCTQENPDTNEPNDTMPTPIALAGTPAMGTTTGYLATDGDVDKYSFDAPSGGRKIIYMHITTPAELMPPPPYRISYTLYDPNMLPIAEGVTPNAFLRVDLAAAKLVRVPGKYTLAVQGYKQNPNDPTVIAGDLRQQYTVNVQILDDVDTNEPNDSLAEAAARPISLAPGASVTKSGRISYTPDGEWFAFDLPGGGPSTLQVKLTAANMMGRFAPLAGSKDRQLRVLAGVPGTSFADSSMKCQTDSNLCPKGYDPADITQQGLVSRICSLFADAGASESQCLWLERNEHDRFMNLKNMEGTIPVPAHGGTLRYYVVAGDDGNNWADDVDWTLTVTSAADPDEARFTSGPVAGAIPGTVNGVLSHGYGRTAEHDPLMGEGIRAPNDYDAVPSDFDQFQFNLGYGTDTGWDLEWEIDKVNGAIPAGLSLQLAFCGASLPDGGCAIRTQTSYQTGNFSPWYSQELADRVIGWDFADMGSYVRIQAAPSQCLCFRSAFTRFQMNVGVVDRDAYAPITYRVRQGTNSYPHAYPRDGGAAMSNCPGAGPDAGGGCTLP